MSEHQVELDRHFAWFEAKLPVRPAKFVGWLRKPSSKLVRIPLAVLLVLGGVLGFLPILGLWMLPLGLVLLAEDVPPLRHATGRILAWIERRHPHWLGLARTVQHHRTPSEKEMS